MRRLVVTAVLALTTFLNAHAATITNTFTESVDAGDFLSPQSVVGSDITQIQGTIGDSDLVDAFKFYFGGGPLAILAQAFVLDVNKDTQLVNLPITLFEAKAIPVDPCAPTDPCHTDNGLLDLSSASLSLSAGNYILGVCQPTDPCLPSDPPYTISFFTGSTTGVAATISAPMPEPATLALFGLGLAGIGAVRRRRTCSRVPAR